MHASLALIAALLAAATSAPPPAAPAKPNAKPNPRVTLDTTKGVIVIELFAEQAPKTVANFLHYVRAHHYDGTIFHRVIPNFMIQGGDPEGTGTGGPGYRFEDELPPPGRYQIGSLAMANAGPNTNGSQFFIVTTAKAPWLDGKHTVFGQVTDGLDVVDKLESVATDGSDRPIEPIGIASIELSD